MNYLSKILPIIILLSLGCEHYSPDNKEIGIATGAVVGAGLGAVVGNQLGEPGGGIAIGSAVGALSGGIIGHSLDGTEVQLNERDRKISGFTEQVKENQRLIDELRARGSDIWQSDRGLVVNLPDILFAFDSAALGMQGKSAIGEISKLANEFADSPISVEGHTDNFGTSVYNERLSLARARTVAQTLTGGGVNKRRLTIRGYGEYRPIADNRTNVGRSRNRRVEVIIENR